MENKDIFRTSVLTKTKGNKRYLIALFIIAVVYFSIDEAAQEAEKISQYVNDRFETTDGGLLLTKPNEINFNEHCRENNIMFLNFEEREAAYQKYREEMNATNAQLRRLERWEKILPELNKKFGGHVDVFTYDFTFMRMVEEKKKEPVTEITSNFEEIDEKTFEERCEKEFEERCEKAYKLALIEWDFLYEKRAE